MHVDLIVETSLPTAPDAAFALSLDPLRFPAAFTGFGPIPSIRHIRLHAAPGVGATRQLENSDGSRPLETITALEPGRRHAYTLSRLNRPFCWLVRAGHADWHFSDSHAGTDVRWSYRFELTSPLAWPLAWPLLNVFMRGAMRRCLRAMGRMLAADNDMQKSGAR